MIAMDLVRSGIEQPVLIAAADQRSDEKQRDERCGELERTALQRDARCRTAQTNSASIGRLSTSSAARTPMVGSRI